MHFSARTSHEMNKQGGWQKVENEVYKKTNCFLPWNLWQITSECLISKQNDSSKLSQVAICSWSKAALQPFRKSTVCATFIQSLTTDFHIHQYPELHVDTAENENRNESAEMRHLDEFLCEGCTAARKPTRGVVPPQPSFSSRKISLSHPLQRWKIQKGLKELSL